MIFLKVSSKNPHLSKIISIAAEHSWMSIPYFDECLTLALFNQSNQARETMARIQKLKTKKSAALWIFVVGYLICEVKSIIIRKLEWKCYFRTYNRILSTMANSILSKVCLLNCIL